MIRTGYSFNFAVGHVAEVVDRIKEIGWEAAPISDRCSTFGYVNWDKATSKAGLRPVFGVELAVVPKLSDSPKKGQNRTSPDYWKFYATSEVRGINDLVHKATSNPGAKQEPSLTYREALGASGVVKVAGERLILDELPDELPDDFYFGVSPATPIGLFRLARRRGLKPIACQDNLYPRASDKNLYRVTVFDRWTKTSNAQTYPQHILSDEEWLAAVSHHEDFDADEAILRRDLLLSTCQAKLKKATLLSPEKNMSLREACEVGAAKLGVDLTNHVYSERLDKELLLIAEKRFEDYFFIIADAVQWARQRMVVGPARGSSCGSLVCYLLEITTIDPIPYDLVFERFIDSTRPDLPDVDIDFSDANRHLVFEYVEQRYGKHRVARLGTVGTFQPKSAMKKIAVSLRVPDNFVEEVSNVVIKRAMGDSRATATLEDTFKTTDPGKRMMELYPDMMMATRLEDHPSNAGQHAAGIVMTDDSILNYVAVDARTGATMCDKYDAEHLNLLKIDALGLIQLSTFERVLELIGQRPVSGWLETIPLDDRKAFDVLNQNHFAGLFQFQPGSALARLCKDMTHDSGGTAFNSVEDLIALTALVRPGPLASGGTSTWIKRKLGQEPVRHFDPAFEPYMGDTYGIAVYQEQVMRIGREVGDLSWEDVNSLRRAMSKSYGKEFFDKYGDPWKRAAIAKGIPEEAANRMWDHMCSFGAMGFNKAHAVAYGLVSYWSCYLKAHYPVEFAAATLDAESDVSQQIIVLRELAKEGVTYVPVDPERSTARWEIATKPDGTKYLVGPLTSVVGMGPVRVGNVLDARRRQAPLPAAEAKILSNPKTKIDSLFPIRDAVSRHLANNPVFNSLPVEERGVDLSSIQVGTPGQPMVFGLVDRLTTTDLNNIIYVTRRNGKRLRGPSVALSVIVHDDTDELMCWVGPEAFETLGKPIVERGRIGRAIYAFKGTIPPNSRRMMRVHSVRYIGEL